MFQDAKNDLVVYYLIGSTVILLLIAAIVAYAFLHQRKILQFRVRLQQEELRAQQAVFDALQEGQENERSRLAEELHDGIGARLSGLKMTLEFLKANAHSHQDIVTRLFNGVSETLEEVRSISHNLQPSFLADRDLETLLSQYMEQLSAMNGCSYDLSINHPLADRLDAVVTLHAYRIITELLHNIHKHARASLASVQINLENDTLEIVVEDNGIGLHTSGAPAEGIGLTNIRNRVKVLKGTMHLDSSDEGTSVIVEIPLALAPS